MNVNVLERITKEFKRIQAIDLEEENVGVVFVYYALCKAKFRISDVAYWSGISDATLYRWGYGESSPNSRGLINKLKTYIEAVKYGLITKQLPSNDETLNSILVKYVNECGSVSSEGSSR